MEELYADGESKFRDPEEGKKLKENVVNQINEHFILIDQWGQIIHIIVYEAKNNNLEDLCLALS